MKKYIHLILLTISILQISNAIGQTLTHKRNFIYTYDAAGNRTQRTYLLVCPTCRTAKVDSAVIDSLYWLAQKDAVELPSTPTEKITSDGSLELKNIYPNPTKGNFVVEFTDEALNANVQITDIQGNKLDEQILSGRQWQLDISLFPSGNYILIIRMTNGKVYSKKIVKI